MRRSLAVILLVICAGFLWVACTSLQADPNSLIVSGTATPSLLPYSQQTADASRLQADLTKQASGAVLSELAIRGTEASMQLTAAVATEQYFVNQTAVSVHLTSTQQAKDTQVAIVNATGTAVFVGTSTAGAQTAISGNATGTAVVKAQTTADASTAVAAIATNASIQRQSRAEENTLMFSTWAPRVGLTLLFIVGLALVGIGGKATWDARWIIAAHLGVVRWGPNGKPYFVAPAFNEDGRPDGITFVEPDKMLSTGVTIQPGRVSEINQGVSERTRLLVNSGAQQISHRLAGGDERGNSSNSQRGAVPAFSQPQLPSDVNIVVMSAEDRRISGWVEDATSHIIDADTSETED